MKGMKTYGIAAGLVALGIAIATGYANLDPDQLKAVLAILNGAGLAALRAGVGKVTAVPEAE